MSAVAVWLSDPPLSVVLVVLAILVLAAAVWLLSELCDAIGQIERGPLFRRFRRVGPVRRPLAPSASLRERMKARLTCLRVGHDEVYSFRLGRPAHRCRYCGHWRQPEVVSHGRWEFRA